MVLFLRKTLGLCKGEQQASMIQTLENPFLISNFTKNDDLKKMPQKITFFVKKILGQPTKNWS